MPEDTRGRELAGRRRSTAAPLVVPHGPRRWLWLTSCTDPTSRRDRLSFAWGPIRESSFHEAVITRSRVYFHSGRKGGTDLKVSTFFGAGISITKPRQRASRQQRGRARQRRNAPSIRDHEVGAADGDRPRRWGGELHGPPAEGFPAARRSRRWPMPALPWRDPDRQVRWSRGLLLSEVPARAHELITAHADQRHRPPD